ncbi:restriction endonuclease subunit S [Tenacibaculum maritimum]|uniref:restriction endonuclease subunit S n=1 Tax=Tenacibaculum maritimum TaxID=107401 RepID=UPI00388F1972
MIPEDWEVVAFDKIFTYYSTSNYSKAQMSEVDEVGCIHYGLIHAIPNTQYDLNNGIKYYVTSEQAKYEYVRNGDVIMVDASEDLEGINKSVEVFGIGDKKYISGLHTYLLRDKKGLLADKFRGIVLNSQFVKNQMLQLAVGMKVFGVSKTQLAKVKILLPPTLKEQKAIATALSDVDDLIVSLEGLIAKKQAIKQGAMQQLLTPPHKGGKRLSGFSGEWVEKKLGEKADLITKGTTPTSLGKTFTSEGISFIKAESIDKTGNIINEKVAHIDIETHNLLGRSKMKNKDLLFTIAGVLGRVGIIREENLPSNTNQAVAIIRLKKSLNLSVSFFFHILRTKTIEKHIEAISVQGAQANFSLTDLSNIPLTIPPDAEEQKAIAKILSDMDAELEQLETKKAKYQQLKQGMLQELLTGNTRLV